MIDKTSIIRDMLWTGGKLFAVLSGGLWRTLTIAVVLTFLSERGVTYNNATGLIVLLAALVWIVQPMIGEFRTYVRYKEVSDVIGDTTRK